MKFKRNNEEKSLRYSIRKYHVGAVSVAVSAMLFLGNSAVYAQNENNVSGGGQILLIQQLLILVHLHQLLLVEQKVQVEIVLLLHQLQIEVLILLHQLQIEVLLHLHRIQVKQLLSLITMET